MNRIEKALIVCAVAVAILGAVSVLVWAKPSSGVQGDLEYRGGPGPGTALIGQAEPGEVVAFGTSGDRRRSVTFGGGERFQLSLDPGTYHFVATSGDAQCQPQDVTVPASRYVDVRFLCGVR
jgi:hypothetical protein